MSQNFDTRICAFAVRYVFMCFVYLSETMTIISRNSITGLVSFVINSVCFALR
jgi:hypothetical protein